MILVVKESHITIKNDVNELKNVFSLIEHFGKTHHLSKHITNRINVCADELISNIIFYGYPDKLMHDIEINISLSDDAVIFKIEDDGIPFNPLERCDPDTHECVESRKAGGLGIHIVKNLMDQLSYKREGNKNMVTFLKNI